MEKKILTFVWDSYATERYHALFLWDFEGTRRYMYMRGSGLNVGSFLSSMVDIHKFPNLIPYTLEDPEVCIDHSKLDKPQDREASSLEKSLEFLFGKGTFVQYPLLLQEAEYILSCFGTQKPPLPEGSLNMGSFEGPVLVEVLPEWREFLKLTHSSLKDLNAMSEMLVQMENKFNAIRDRLSSALIQCEKAHGLTATQWTYSPSTNTLLRKIE